MVCYCWDLYFSYFWFFYDYHVPPFPLNFSKIWGWSPHVPNVCLSAPASRSPRSLGEHSWLLTSAVRLYNQRAHWFSASGYISKHKKVVISRGLGFLFSFLFTHSGHIYCRWACEHHAMKVVWCSSIRSSSIMCSRAQNWAPKWMQSRVNYKFSRCDM